MSAVAASRSRRTHGKMNFASASGGSSTMANFTRISKLKSVGKELEEKVAGFVAGKRPAFEIILTSASPRKRKADKDTERETAFSTQKSCKKLCQELAKPLDEIETSLQKKKLALERPQIAANSSALSRDVGGKRKRQSDISTQENESIVPAADTSSAAQAEALLKQLNLQSSPAPKRAKTSAPRQELSLPSELVDLVHLHASLLKTLSLHYAHNGTDAPADVRAICPNIAQAWGKRKVTVEDVRRCIGILEWTPGGEEMSSSSPLSLFDYGRGKLCIECSSDVEPGPLRERELNREFETKLRHLWSAHQDSNVEYFVAGLPKAVITDCETRNRAPPLLAKGQQALEGLRADILKKQQQKEQNVQPPPALNADGSKMSLLDRVRLRELQQAEAAAQGPTAADLERRAALQRAEDVAAVVGMLATSTSGRARVSFTMSAVLVKLRDSLRTPVSREDGAACVRLLAREVAPEWLRVTTVRGKENIVVQVAFQPSRTMVQERVKALLA